MSGEQMPKEEQDYIERIFNFMMKATNMTKEQAWGFAFRCWQFKNNSEFMSLLQGDSSDKHYIRKVIKEEYFKNPDEKEAISAIIEVNYQGTVRQERIMCFLDEWERVKNQGFYKW